MSTYPDLFLLEVWSFGEIWDWWFIFRSLQDKNDTQRWDPQRARLARDESLGLTLGHGLVKQGREGQPGRLGGKVQEKKVGEAALARGQVRCGHRRDRWVGSTRVMGDLVESPDLSIVGTELLWVFHWQTGPKEFLPLASLRGRKELAMGAELGVLCCLCW